MTESEIKKNAPDGATHYGDNDNYDHLVNYFIIKDGVFYHWCGRDWLEMKPNELTDNLKPL